MCKSSQLKVFTGNKTVVVIEDFLLPNDANKNTINFSSDNANDKLITGNTYLNNVIYQLDGVIVTKTKYKEN